VVHRCGRGRTCVALLLLALLGAVAGCGSGSGSDSKAGTTTSTTPRVATVAPGQLTRPGILTACSDIPAPPFEFYDQSQRLVGLDVDVVDQAAARLGLNVSWQNAVFDTIIEALDSGKCDIIASSAYITPERTKQITMVPYMQAGQSLLLDKAQPANVGDVTRDPTGLCGHSVAVLLASAEADSIKEIDRSCKAAGKPTIKSVVVTKTPDGLQQLKSGYVDAFFYDSPTNNYYAEKISPNDFSVANGVLHVVPYGYGFAKPHGQLVRAFVQALTSMKQDGSYARIFKAWGQDAVPIPPFVPQG
jgi:polar amino acid transport system substrate-binding protein